MNKILVGVVELEKDRFNPWTKKHIHILEYNNIQWIHLAIDKSDFYNDLKKCTHVIFCVAGRTTHRYIGSIMIPIMDKFMGKRVFPDYNTFWTFDDKIKETILLKINDFPIADSNVFFEKQRAIKWVNLEASFPLVFKLKTGAGSMNVILVRNKKKANQIINRMFSTGVYSEKVPFGKIKIKLYKKIRNYVQKTYRRLNKRDISHDWELEKNYVYFQKFLPNNDYDTRITIIGNRAFAFRRFNRKNDFRSSGSGKIDYNTNGINLDMIKIAFKISKKLNFSSMAYDFLYDEEIPVIGEISYAYLDVAIYNCPGYWDLDLNWHEGNYWPEFFHLIDLLQISDLKCPKFLNE
ncbi:MAG: hypothetical protein JW866_10080 [Ignavibacteriales bacterium]|nr:hypothetical protein [Ignavibacteriales bacterium]